MTRILYECLGGTAGITAIVDSVVEAHMCNSAINGDIRLQAFPANARRMLRGA